MWDGEARLASLGHRVRRAATVVVAETLRLAVRFYLLSAVVVVVVAQYQAQPVVVAVVVVVVAQVD